MIQVTRRGKRPFAIRINGQAAFAGIDGGRGLAGHNVATAFHFDFKYRQRTFQQVIVIEQVAAGRYLLDRVVGIVLGKRRVFPDEHRDPSRQGFGGGVRIQLGYLEIDNAAALIGTGGLVDRRKQGYGGGAVTVVYRAQNRIGPGIRGQTLPISGHDDRQRDAARAERFQRSLVETEFKLIEAVDTNSRRLGIGWKIDQRILGEHHVFRLNQAGRGIAGQIAGQVADLGIQIPGQQGIQAGHRDIGHPGSVALHHRGENRSGTEIVAEGNRDGLSGFDPVGSALDGNRVSVTQILNVQSARRCHDIDTGKGVLGRDIARDPGDVTRVVGNLARACAQSVDPVVETG